MTQSAQKALELAQQLPPGAERIDALRQTPNRDYRYRALAEAEVAAVVTQMVLAIDYPNFKDNIADDKRRGFYAQIWNILWDIQRALKGV